MNDDLFICPRHLTCIVECYGGHKQPHEHDSSCVTDGKCVCPSCVRFNPKDADMLNDKQVERLMKSMGMTL